MTRELLLLTIETALMEQIDEDLIDQLVTVMFSLEEDECSSN